MGALHFYRTKLTLDVFNKIVAEEDLVAKYIEVAACQPVISLPLQQIIVCVQVGEGSLTIGPC